MTERHNAGISATGSSCKQGAREQKNTILSITLDKTLHTSALIFVHSLCWRPSHHMHSRTSSVAGLEQVLHKTSLTFLVYFSGGELAGRFAFPAEV